MIYNFVNFVKSEPVKFVKKVGADVVEFWKDDRGIDAHVTRLVYGAMAFVVSGLVITSVGLLIRNKAISFGNDIGSFKTQVNTTNAANASNNVGYGSGNTTVTTVNVQ